MCISLVAIRIANNSSEHIPVVIHWTFLALKLEDSSPMCFNLLNQGNKMIRTVKIEITITLNEKEAAWLHAIMQNPLAANETKQDEATRIAFFKATQPIR